MDIAKIRKKLKKSGAVHGQSQDSRAATTTPEDRVTEPETSLPDAPHGHTPDAGQQTGNAGQRDVHIGEEPGSISQEETKDKEEKAEPSETEYLSESAKADEIIEILTFRLMKEEFAFRISQLKEILRFQRITAVPRVPDYVLGITSLRGKVIPVIDLRLKLSLTDRLSDYVNAGKILIVEGPKGPIGATVDKVTGVVRITKSEILPPPSHLSENELKFIEGIALVDKRFVSIINMEETLTLNSR
jgi:purine-binding chemotaxis protein CheW